MSHPFARFPGAETLDWVAKTAGARRVVGGRRMTGGITSSVHRLTVADRAGNRRHLVLRRWIDPQVATGQRLVKEEGEILGALTQRGFPAPAPIGVSDGSETEGVAAVLMTRAPGHVLLTPRDPDDWLRQIADLLPRVHALDITAPPAHPQVAQEPRPVPDWIGRPDVWDAAQAVLSEPPPEQAICFTHTDFQHFNLLWQRERLTGVVDWTWPKMGAPDLDVGHCRLNLAVLHSVEWAEQFRLAYEAAAGRRVDPWFDIRRITWFSSDWQRFIPLQVGDRAKVDIAGMPRRVEDLLVTALKRV